MTRHRTINDIEQKSGHMVSETPLPIGWSHDFNFPAKVMVYGVVHLLYGVVASDSVYHLRRVM